MSKRIRKKNKIKKIFNIKKTNVSKDDIVVVTVDQEKINHVELTKLIPAIRDTFSGAKKVIFLGKDTVKIDIMKEEQ